MYVYMGAYGDHKYTHIWLAINQSPILFVRSGRDCCINKDIFVDMILGVDSVNAKLVGVADARAHEHIVLVFMASLCVCVFLLPHALGGYCGIVGSLYDLYL